MRLGKLTPLAFACGASALSVVALPWSTQNSWSSLVGGCLGYISGLTHSEEKTIYQVLKDDKQYSRLVKALELSESIVDLLDDPSESITFFAVPNSGFPRHRRPHHGDHRHESSPISFLADSSGGISPDLGDLVQQAEEIEKIPDSRDKEKRRQALSHIIHKIAAYHILPQSHESADLVQNSTYATNLTFDDGSEPLRLSIFNNLFPPRLKINFVVEVTKRDIKAKNGVIHQISRPLLPPPSIFQETFFLPKIFSFFTTAIQRVGLAGAIDWTYSKDDGHFSGTKATTAFAPTSGAFERLPKKLRSYLFSPFGRKALKKLLEYHIAPGYVLYTDYLHNSTSDDDGDLDFELELVPETQFPMPIFDLYEAEDVILPRTMAPSPLPELIYEYNVTLPTLLHGHSLHIHAARYKSRLSLPRSARYFTIFKVNGRHVVPIDVPARNGALHVLSAILDPRKGHGHDHDNFEGNVEDTWEDWEEWLPQWAMEN